jgi:hypothetical protein
MLLSSQAHILCGKLSQTGASIMLHFCSLSDLPLLLLLPLLLPLLLLLLLLLLPPLAVQHRHPWHV